MNAPAHTHIPHMTPSLHAAQHTLGPKQKPGCLAKAATLFCGLALVAGPVWAEQPQTGLPRTELGAGMHVIQAQVASTPQQRSVGLMWRQEMPANEGMLFVFERPETQCFWMKNTLLPLTAAFVDDDGKIVNLADMKPQTTDSHCSQKPVRFVLEMHQGWFAKRGLQAGTQLRGKPFTPR